MSPNPVTERPERRDWRRAWRALRLLIEDPQRTEQVFEIFEALDGPADARMPLRFAEDPRGKRLLRKRPDLLSVLTDRSTLAALPEGTLGRAYAEFMTHGELSAQGLAEADRARPGRPAEPPGDGPLSAGDRDHDRDWIGDRLRDAHDLWHVVTGYGMDEAGEAALLAFTHAQLGNLGMALVALAAAVRGPKDWRLSWQRYLARAWWRGRRARWLATVPWEAWLERPLVCVQRDLRVEAPERAHPGGVLVASPKAAKAAKPGAVFTRGRAVSVNG